MYAILPWQDNDKGYSRFGQLAWIILFAYCNCSDREQINIPDGGSYRTIFLLFSKGMLQYKVFELQLKLIFFLSVYNTQTLLLIIIIQTNSLFISHFPFIFSTLSHPSHSCKNSLLSLTFKLRIYYQQVIKKQK
jgi:hypothetical protein